jgi:hypothetical protein
MTDVPSHSFGSNPAWFCKNESELLTLFISMFPLPQQKSWTVFQVTSEISMRVILMLQMQLFTMDEFRRLPTIGQHVGKMVFLCPTFGSGPLLTGRAESSIKNEHEHSSVSQLEFQMEAMVLAEQLWVTQYRRLSWPLALGCKFRSQFRLLMGRTRSKP